MTDSEILDYLDKLPIPSGSGWKLRPSSTGRGWRLLTTSERPNTVSVRRAVEQFAEGAALDDQTMDRPED